MSEINAHMQKYTHTEIGCRDVLLCEKKLNTVIYLDKRGSLLKQSNLILLPRIIRPYRVFSFSFVFGFKRD